MPKPEAVAPEVPDVDLKAPWWVNLMKVLVVPVVGMVVAGWFDFRLRKQEREHVDNAKQVEVTYDTGAHAARDLATQVAVLTGRIDTLEKLVLALDHQADTSYPALNSYKRALVNKLARPMSAPSLSVPASLGEAMQQSAK